MKIVFEKVALVIGILAWTFAASGATDVLRGGGGGDVETTTTMMMDPEEDALIMTEMEEEEPWAAALDVAMGDFALEEGEDDDLIYTDGTNPMRMLRELADVGGHELPDNFQILELYRKTIDDLIELRGYNHITQNEVLEVVTMTIYDMVGHENATEAEKQAIILDMMPLLVSQIYLLVVVMYCRSFWFVDALTSDEVGDDPDGCVVLVAAKIARNSCSSPSCGNLLWLASDQMCRIIWYPEAMTMK